MKRPFTLMEIMIGLSLAAIVIGMLFTSLYETTMTSARLARAEAVVLGRAEVQQRLDGIFSNLASNDQTQTPLYLNKKTLKFKYRCGIDPDIRFSNEVTGELLLRNGVLLIRVAGNSLPGKGEVEPREAALKKGVKSLSYEFLSHGEASPRWDQDEKAPPSFLKLTLTLEGDKVEEYAFWVTHDPNGVTVL